MQNSILQVLVRLWEINDLGDKENIDLIVAISYDTGRNALANATREILQKAIALKKQHSNATLAFGNCAYVFPSAEETERKLKEKILREYGVNDYVSAPEAINNSIEEARVIKRTLLFSPKRILIVTGEMHSRSAHYIWEKIFPDAEILIQTIPYRYEYQSDQEVWWLRHGPWVWFLGNILRQVLIHFYGLDKVARMRHGTRTFIPSPTNQDRVREIKDDLA